MLKDITKLDFAYLETFTNRIDTSWGAFFCNEEHPNYYDANHAFIAEAPANPGLAIDEVIRFYQEKNLMPRFYLYQIDKLGPFIEELKTRGFGYESFISPVQLWNNEVIQLPEDPNVTVEVAGPQQYEEALSIKCSIEEFGGRETIEKAFKTQFEHPAFTHYLLRYNGTACAAACLFEHGNQARLESVATLSSYRGKGLVGHLIRFIQQETVNKGIQQLWVLPINEQIEKVYGKYGFDTVLKMETGHAFRGGRSILEIRGS
ncbi:GNAT family N-acetyltransferase [Metabacillus sp. GX 13764]|uniref:GNAT family N-acetyltransferase n=1 Tax=Metabacillus kandeliae TaxID=2900151 RepID=UPI001E3378BB|nr:GNAT family N-acetyltransferase [Metabacillus kandeliae]MCD7034601.1 GNAT family N-acetyltransferase [Metabacillus kandeliae]